MNFKRSLFTLLAVMACSINAFAQSQEKVYSLMILSFAKGIQWPEFSVGDKFTIGVLEYRPLAAELQSSTSAVRIGIHPVEVKEFTHVDEVTACQILFIPAYKARQLSSLLARKIASPILIVTNKSDLIEKGSDINFILVDGKLRYQINCKSIEKRGMKVSSNVKGRGILVEP